VLLLSRLLQLLIIDEFEGRIVDHPVVRDEHPLDRALQVHKVPEGPLFQYGDVSGYVVGIVLSQGMPWLRLGGLQRHLDAPVVGYRMVQLTINHRVHDVNTLGVHLIELVTKFVSGHVIM